MAIRCGSERVDARAIPPRGSLGFAGELPYAPQDGHEWNIEELATSSDPQVGQDKFMVIVEFWRANVVSGRVAWL